MPKQDKNLRIAREAIEQEAWRIEQRRVELKHREAKLARALTELRSACPHAGPAVEFHLMDTRGKITVEDVRFCLRCGQMEYLTSHLSDDGPKPAFKVILRATKIHRTDFAHDWTLFGDRVGIYRQRLHERALFEEFDAQGEWLGEKKSDESHIRRGED